MTAVQREAGTGERKGEHEVAGPPTGLDVESVYREHGERLWRSLFAWTGGDRELADDAVAESFPRLIEHADSVRQPVGWLYRTAFRLVLAERRRARGVPEPPASPRSMPADLLEVVDALRRLSPSQRAAIVLRYEADLSNREIARAMETSEAAVRVHLYRGRSRLRELLGSEESDDA